MNTRREFLKYGAIGAIGMSARLPLLASGIPMLNLPLAKYFEACTNGNLNALKALLTEYPGLLQTVDDQGKSGFTVSLLNGHSAIGNYLVEAGYKRDLHEVVLDLDWEKFEQLVGEESENTAATINRHHPMGGSVMWAAAAAGAGSNIWRVYAKCGDPNATLPKAASLTTPLQTAIRYRDLPIAELSAATLLSNNADPNLSLSGDLSPLHIAAERGSYEIVEMLIRHGAKVDGLNKDQKTAKQIAELQGHLEVYQLLQDEAQIARTCRTSRSAFDIFGNKYQAPDISDIPLFLRRKFVGQSHGNIDFVKKEATADARYVHSIATTSEKSIEACAHTGRKNIIEFLLEKGAPYSLPTAVLMNDITTVKKYLDQDPNRIHERGAHDFALLWYPVLGRCDLDMTQLLLDRGAKVEEQHFLGTTALHWACMRGPIELVELLVENGADVNRIGRKFGKSEAPLQFTKDEKIINYLKSKGARI